MRIIPQNPALQHADSFHKEFNTTRSVASRKLHARMAARCRTEPINIIICDIISAVHAVETQRQL